MSQSKFTFLGVALALATLDAMSTWMMIIFYTAGIDVLTLVNFNFMLLSAVLLLGVLTYHRAIILKVSRANDLGVLFWLLLIASVAGVANLAAGLVDGAKFDAKHALTQFYGLGMPLICLAFTSQFNKADAERVGAQMVRFSWAYSAIAFSGIFVYAILYYFGYITYFGLGTNAHYVLPWLLASKGPTLLVPVGLLILMSGKRAVLLNFVVQTIVYFSRSMLRKPVLGVVFALGAGGMAYVLVQYTNLLDRFVMSFAAVFNLSDPYALLIAFGGRGEEVVGIQQYFAEHPSHLLLGAPPGESYRWIVEASGLDVAKNYAHITPVGLVFRHGIIITTALYGLFAYFLAKYFSPKDPYYLSFVGIISSTIFGANMIVDPTTWLLIGLMIRLSKNSRETAGSPAEDISSPSGVRTEGSS